MTDATGRPQIAVRHPDEDKVAAVDALDVATRIIANGARAAIGASTVELVALARRTLALQTLADLTFEMIAAIDGIRAGMPPAELAALRRVVDRKASLVEASLEALGFQFPQPQQGEETDVTKQD